MLKRVVGSFRTVISNSTTISASTTSIIMYSNGERRYSTVERACANTTEYRMYLTNKQGKFVSPWHDIPLYANKNADTFNMVCEIPRWTQAKLEICTKEPLNPLKHDVKNNKVRFVDNCFPHHGYIWNYGAFPQTWEDPDHVDSETNAKGDNDPIDVIEVGQKLAKRGEVIEVKILGTLALIDEGETDWKIVCINVSDPLAPVMNEIDDVEKYLPGLLSATHEWFKIYKIPAGKSENKFAFNGQYKKKDYATKIVLETHEFWKRLVENCENDKGLYCKAAECDDTFEKLSTDDCKQIVNSKPPCGPPEEAPESIHKWHYIKTN